MTTYYQLHFIIYANSLFDFLVSFSQIITWKQKIRNYNSLWEHVANCCSSPSSLIDSLMQFLNSISEFTGRFLLFLLTLTECYLSWGLWVFFDSLYWHDVGLKLATHANHPVKSTCNLWGEDMNKVKLITHFTQNVEYIPAFWFILFSYTIFQNKTSDNNRATIITPKGNNNNNSIFKWRYDCHIGNCDLGNCKLNQKKFWYFNVIRRHGLCVSTVVLYKLSYEDLFIGSRPICWVHLCPVNRMNPVNLHSK